MFATIAGPLALRQGALARQRHVQACYSYRSLVSPALAPVTAAHCVRRAGYLCQRRPLAAPQASAAAAAEQPSPLQFFLQWLVNNGVLGVGTAESKVALYDGANGERGVIAVQPIAKDTAVLKVPMHLAIADQTAEAPEGSGDGAPPGEGPPLYEGAPWSVRLAARLLQLRGEGAACPWYPYIQVLPRAVPTPVTTFSWADVEAVQYQPMRRQLDAAAWVASAAWEALGAPSPGRAAAALGGAPTTRADLEWALTVVHSRTFGSAGHTGGVGVRMLVPLVDMLNHAGDVVEGGFGANAVNAAVASDNVRWDLVSKVGGEWWMVVTATRAIEAGEELLLSYGERNSDDFFLHYGFVPPRNPHDDVSLFTNTESMIDWHLDRYLPPGALPPAALQAGISAAYRAAAQQENGEAAEQALASAPEAEAAVIRAEMARIKLSAGGMVDARLIAAFQELHAAAAAGAGRPCSGAEREAHVRQAVGDRARQLLAGMPTSLLADLEALAAWEAATGDTRHSFAEALAHYRGVAAQVEVPAAAAGAAAAAAAAAAAPQPAGSSTGRKPSPFQDVVEEEAPAPGETPLDAGAGLGDAALLAQLQQARQPAAAAEAGAGGGAAAGKEPSLLPVMYRCYKKQVLWDAILVSQFS